MRFLAQAGVCVLVGLLAAGCNPINDKRYMDEGAGVELGYASLSEATKEQDRYILEVCQQTVRPSSVVLADAPLCTGEIDWQSFAIAGINDINRRCDAYLTWLEARRRDRAPFLKEIIAVTGATNSILSASNADSTTLGIVSAALALAGASYENWNSRLLLAINHSTVVDIVYSRQRQFVDNWPRKIDSRPAAIYLLRNYLRLCMPTTIEADINTSMTLVQRGHLSDARDRPIVPLIGVPSAAQYLGPTRQLDEKVRIGHPLSGREESIRLADGIRIQMALGISPANGDFGVENSATRLRLKEFETAYYQANSLFPPRAPVPTQNIDGIVRTDAEHRAVISVAGVVKNCGSAKFASIYEMAVFANLSPNGVRNFVIRALRYAKAQGKIQAVPPIASVASVQCEVPPDMREAIKRFKEIYQIGNTGEIDHGFMQKAAEGQ